MLAALAVAALLPVFESSAGPAYSRRNPIPPRLQWEANGGYCGEVSLISAGLYFGQYLSQYDARVCAIGSTPQNEGELLLGVNDRIAARRMHLKPIVWKSQRQKSTDEFLHWLKLQVVLRHPVAIGVYDNADLLGTPGVVDPEYDHIVPVMRIRSLHPLSNRRIFGSDRLTFSDNGLFGVPGNHPYLFTDSFADFPASRRQVSGDGGPLYGLPDYGTNYGIAIAGVMDAGGDTVPVRVRTDKNYELPAILRKSTIRPAAMPLVLTITVSQLIPGVAYKLYRYDRLASIPGSHFNAHAANAAKSLTIRITHGLTFRLTQKILSDEIAAYRCVRANAP